MSDAKDGGPGGRSRRPRKPAGAQGNARSKKSTSPVSGRAAAPDSRGGKPARAAAGAGKGKTAAPVRASVPPATPSRRASKPTTPRPKPGLPQSRSPRQEPAPFPPALEAGALTEEERIESAKYLSGAPKERPRLFEEERFLFPESYGVDRVRLLVKDPHWLFAYWDVAPASWENARRDLGERAFAMSRLTLRVSDPNNGGTSVILLPPGARSWYVRVDSTRRSYRAELGFTLPSGEFRRLADSNTVVTPRVGPSAERATRRILYREARGLSPEAMLAVLSPPPAAGPFVAPAGPELPDTSYAVGSGQGGASDVFRR